MKNINKGQEYDNLLNQIKYLTNFIEKDTDKIIGQVVKTKLGEKVETIKQEYKQNKEPELNKLRVEVLNAYYGLMKKTIFEKDLSKYQCEKTYPQETRTRLLKTANEKISQLPQDITFKDMSEDEVKNKATEVAKQIELSKRYLGEVLKSGEGIAKVDNIHKMFEAYDGTKKAVREWVFRENMKQVKEVTKEVGRTLFDILVGFGTVTSNVLKEFANDYEANKNKVWETPRSNISSYPSSSSYEYSSSNFNYNEEKSNYQDNYESSLVSNCSDNERKEEEPPKNILGEVMDHYNFVNSIGDQNWRKF